jgi:hypothetical protein
MTRRIAASLAALGLLLVITAPVLAGGWAEIVADAQTTEPPVEGTPIEVGFTVLQHGQTPAPWESPTVHFTDSTTGKQIDVVATNDRPDGHFVATATLPQAGFWTWQVTLRDLASEQPPVAVTVLTASGAQPPFDPSITLTAIDRAKREMVEVMNSRFGPEIERLDGLLAAERSRTERLETELGALEVDRVATADGGDGLPIIGLVTIAVLAGATAGFAMAWLAGRPRPRVTLSPAPNPASRGADPV